MLSLRGKIGALVFALLLGLAGTASAQLRCLPSCNSADGRFLAIAGSNLVTLSDTQLDLTISVPAGATSFQLGIFDGDSRGVDLGGVPHWDTGSAAIFTYTLYADPNANGSGLNIVELLPATPVLLSTLLPDNGWFDVTIPTSPLAQTPSGNYFYRLNIIMTTPSSTADGGLAPGIRWPNSPALCSHSRPGSGRFAS